MNSPHLTSYFWNILLITFDKMSIDWGHSFEFQINTVLKTNFEQVELVI